MSRVGLRVVSETPIELPGGAVVLMDFLSQCIGEVNDRFKRLQQGTMRMDLDVFEVIDFRMLSALVGEALVGVIGERHGQLRRNPNIDGYPDLLCAHSAEQRGFIERCAKDEPAAFIKFKFGGLEVKNTFGTKRGGAELPPGATRVGKVNPKLDWKAHHRYTNHLLGLVSDFIGGCPQIVAAMYSDELNEQDWKKKANPKAGSTMTSFSVIARSGADKLREGLRLCHEARPYLDFFGVEDAR